jgi:hypothetical protein
VGVAALESTLAGTDGGAYRLDELAAGPARVVLLFAHSECPTARLALERLGPLGPALEASGVRLVWVLQEPLETAARLARRHRLEGLVLAERPPYETARALDVHAVPTTIALERDGTVSASVVGWSADALNELLPVRVPDDAPRWKPGCEARPAYDAYRPARGQDDFDELEDMFERGWTDGLPVVPPTADRVAAMLGAFDPDRSLGAVPPGLGEATLERVAACAVLAGCKPAYFPVVVAAVEAMLEPAFNLHGQAVTTSPPGQIVIVNGPVRDALELSSGMGALGPGRRANLTIGRAVRLVVQLTGRGEPGALDRATLGQPGKLSFCFAENEEASPWEPLSVERGFPADASTVTLIAGDAPLSISDHRSRAPEELAAALGWGAATLWSPNWWPIGAATLFVICPEHADTLAAGGWTKADVRRAIWEAVQRPAGELRRGEFTERVGGAADAEPIPKWDSPDDILLIVAGGEAGRFSAVFGPCVGMDWSPVTQEVRCDT